MFEFIEDEEVRAKAIEAHEAAQKEILESVDEKINEATSGLKTKNEELLDEKKKIAKALKNFEGVDAEAARDALKFLEENADAQLIKDGKIEELLEKRTSTLRSDYEAQMNELQTSLSTAMETGSTYKSRYESKMIEDALREAAIAAKVLPEALYDISLRGSNVFSLAEDGSVEARDRDGKLAKTQDGKSVLTTSNWIEDLKKSSPHYWPRSESAGAHRGDGTTEGDYNASLAAAADRGDMKEFRRLRALKKK